MRNVTALLVLVLVVSSGCLSGVEETVDEETTTTSSEGYLEVETVDEVPENATVVEAENEHVRDHPVLREAIENTTETGENETVHITGERVRQVEEALGELPWYSGPGPNGHYIRNGDTVVLVYLKVLD